MKQDGTTLMELMVAVAIIGIVAGMAVPDFLMLTSRVQTRCATEEIASELRLARQLAITHRDRVRVVFDLEQKEIAAHFVNAAATHHIYRYGDKGILIDELSAGPEIVFHPSGRSATATTIQLRNKEGQVQKLTVGMTGRVAIL